jgi:hypothetical protein
MAKNYVVMRRWKDNPSDFQIVDYFESIAECEEYILTQKKDILFDLEVGKYE